MDTSQQSILLFTPQQEEAKMCGWMAVKTVGLSAWQTAVWCSATVDHLRQAHSHKTQVLAMAVWSRASTLFPYREVQWDIVD